MCRQSTLRELFNFLIFALAMSSTKMHLKRLSYILSTLTVVLVLAACSNKRNTWLSRNYQKLTSHYNVYFNGAEAFRVGTEKITENYEFDYSHILPVYTFADASAAKVGSSDMETALKKGHKLIQLHSITAKPERKAEMTEADKRFYAQEEFNPYVAEAYLLIGKANVVNHAENEAMEVFDYLSRKYEGRDCCYEGKIWKAIGYAQLGQYASAHSALESFDLDGMAPAKYFGAYEAASANILILEEKYAEAIPHMKNAVDGAPDRVTRRRYTYILAQLYREVGNKTEAAPLFLALSRQHSDAKMGFAAQMELASVATTPLELAAAEKKLRKMANDAKNKKRLDQIYYALGQMEENRGNTDAALANYNTSILESVENDNQKGLSFLATADIYQAVPKYLETATALDSAAFYLNDNNFRKAETVQRAATLQPLARDLRIIVRNDSLMRIATMNTADRDAFIQAMLDKQAEEIRAREEAALAEQEAAMSQSEYYQLTRGGTNATATNQKWYFYNNTSVSAGKSAFSGKWGRRKNEDNWRRANKQSVVATNDADDTTVSDTTSTASNANGNSSYGEQPEGQPYTRESLLAGLPLTADAQAACLKETDNALFEAGAILYDNIHDYPSAAKQLSTLLKRFPQSEHRYDALVILYFARQKSSDASGAQDVASIIKREYAESSFAKYLSNPSGYFANEQQVTDAKEAMYKSAYNAYITNNFGSAISISSSAIADEGNATYVPKYLLVRALSYAKQAESTHFRADLETITRDYSGGEEDSVARALLAMLDQGLTPVRASNYNSPFDSDVLKTEGEAATQDYNFAFRADTTHTIVCVINSDAQNRAQYLIADYNFDHFLLRDYEIQSTTLPDGRLVIMVEGFDNKTEAMNYYYALRDCSFWSEITDAALPEIYAVSDNNTRNALLASLSDKWRKFFNEYYLGK